MLMYTPDRAVHHLHVAIVRRRPPTVEPMVHGLAMLRGQFAPWRARAQYAEHTVEGLSVVLRLGTLPIHRQNRLDYAPFEVGEIAAHDASSSFCEREALFESRV
jgi:hypothetical protein